MRFYLLLFACRAPSEDPLYPHPKLECYGAGCTAWGKAAEESIGQLRDLGAARYYLKACGSADPEACYRLGALYAQGRGVLRDLKAASRFYQKSCGALGELYSNGETLGRDEAKAKALYQEACEYGDKSACRGSIDTPYPSEGE